jgi:hypothetical protein
MTTRTITGVVHHASGAVWVGATVTFEMERGTFTLSPDVTYLQDGVTAVTDSDGAFTTALTAGLDVYWRCSLPDGTGFRFSLDTGSVITLEELRATSQGTPPAITFPTAPFLDLGDYGGAPGDDIAAPLALAIAALPSTGGIIYLGPGSYELSTTMTAIKHVQLMGAGVGNVLTPVTEIVWTGGAAAMFAATGTTASWSFDGIHLDGNNTATYGVDIVDMQDQHWGTLSIEQCVTSLAQMRGIAAPMSWNTFDHLILNVGGTANMLRIDGSAISNVCHNLFTKISGSKAGTGTGVWWGNSDNNVVLSTFIFQQDSVATIGWEWVNGTDAAARANYVHHMQVGSLTARAGTRNSSSWYDRENGQAEPTIESGATYNYENEVFGKHTQALTIHNDSGGNTQFNVAGVGDNNIRGLKTTFSHLVTSNAATGGLGYSTGAGSTVTQGTDKSTGVTLNTVCGTITMHAAALGSGATATFTLTNSTIAATDVVHALYKGGGTADAYDVWVTNPAAGSCHLNVKNLTGGSLSEAATITFMVLKAVAA